MKATHHAFLLSPLLWFICKIITSVCDYMIHFLKTLCKHAFIHFQISENVNDTSPNNAVPQDWWLYKSVNTTSCFAMLALILSSATRSWWQPIILFLGFLCHNHCILQTHSYNSHRKAKVRRTGTKSPTKANTDHHNGDLKLKKYQHLNLI